MSTCERISTDEVGRDRSLSNTAVGSERRRRARHSMMRSRGVRTSRWSRSSLSTESRGPGKATVNSTIHQGSRLRRSAPSVLTSWATQRAVKAAAQDRSVAGMGRFNVVPGPTVMVSANSQLHHDHRFFAAGLSLKHQWLRTAILHLSVSSKRLRRHCDVLLGELTEVVVVGFSISVRRLNHDLCKIVRDLL